MSKKLQARNERGNMDMQNLVWGFVVLLIILFVVAPLYHVIMDRLHDVAELTNPNATRHILVDVSAPTNHPTYATLFGSVPITMPQN